jgi:hypothetical protein
MPGARDTVALWPEEAGLKVGLYKDEFRKAVHEARCPPQKAAATDERWRREVAATSREHDIPAAAGQKCEVEPSDGYLGNVGPRFEVRGWARATLRTKGQGQV